MTAQQTLPKKFEFKCPTGQICHATYDAEENVYDVGFKGKPQHAWYEAHQVNSFVNNKIWHIVQPSLPQSFKFTRKNLPNFYFRASLTDSKTFGKAYKVICYSAEGHPEEECYHSVESTEQFVEIDEWLIVDEAAEARAQVVRSWKTYFAHESFIQLDAIAEAVKELLEEKNV